MGAGQNVPKPKCTHIVKSKCTQKSQNVPTNKSKNVPRKVKMYSLNDIYFQCQMYP